MSEEDRAMIQRSKFFLLNIPNTIQIPVAFGHICRVLSSLGADITEEFQGHVEAMAAAKLEPERSLKSGNLNEKSV